MYVTLIFVHQKQNNIWVRPAMCEDQPMPTSNTTCLCHTTLPLKHQHGETLLEGALPRQLVTNASRTAKDLASRSVLTTVGENSVVTAPAHCIPDLSELSTTTQSTVSRADTSLLFSTLEEEDREEGENVEEWEEEGIVEGVDVEEEEEEEDGPFSSPPS